MEPRRWTLPTNLKKTWPMANANWVTNYNLLLEMLHNKKIKLKHTKISSFPNWVLMKFARDAMLLGSVTSSWWKTTWSERPNSFSFSTASRPLFSSLAVSTTVIPLEANCLHIPNPIPLFAPVTTAYLCHKANSWQLWIKKHLRALRVWIFHFFCWLKICYGKKIT